MGWEENKSKIIKDYQQQYQKFGVNSNSLFIPGRKQNVRYNIIKDIGITANDSVLDIGCGFGDLFTFLQQTISYKGKYTGFDITPEFIDVSKGRFPKTDFRIFDILSDETDEKWDYVVLTGTLNIKTDELHLDFIKKMVSKMFHFAKKGVSFDLISISGDDRYDYIFRADPLEIYNFCKLLTQRITLRNDYMPYEFTVYLLKDESITSDNIYNGYNFPEIIKY